jgi:dihydroxyacid dehydratase/phosphogluconate dehydratase
VPDAVIAARKAAFKPMERPAVTGYLKRYAALVRSADSGAVFKE